MSGGSWEYVSHKIEEVADRLAQDREPLRRALSKRVSLLALAMHAIEWVDSGDYARGDDREAIERFMGPDARALEIQVVIEEAKRIGEQLKSLTERNP